MHEGEAETPFCDSKLPPMSFSALPVCGVKRIGEDVHEGEAQKPFCGSKPPPMSFNALPMRGDKHIGQDVPTVHDERGASTGKRPW